MKYKIVFALAILGFAGSLHAAANPNKAPENYVSQAVFIPTHTAINSVQVFVSSFGPVSIHGVTINTAGDANATLELWDSQLSTDPASGAVLIASINTSSTKSLQYDINTSTGFCINNRGAINPADITVSWRKR